MTAVKRDVCRVRRPSGFTESPETSEGNCLKFREEWQVQFFAAVPFGHCLVKTSRQTSSDRDVFYLRARLWPFFRKVMWMMRYS